MSHNKSICWGAVFLLTAAAAVDAVEDQGQRGGHCPGALPPLVNPHMNRTLEYSDWEQNPAHSRSQYERENRRMQATGNCKAWVTIAAGRGALSRTAKEAGTPGQSPEALLSKDWPDGPPVNGGKEALEYRMHAQAYDMAFAGAEVDPIVRSLYCKCITLHPANQNQWSP